MRLLIVLLLASPILAGCGCQNDPCAGLTCAPYFVIVEAHVTDEAGAPIPNPDFSGDGVEQSFQGCLAHGDGGAGCLAWEVAFFDTTHVITASAPGYRPSTTVLDLQSPSQKTCCGPKHTAQASLVLTRASR
jgi:hypothetical protein